MAVTYALIDPFMAVIRPVVAFLTAVLAGVGVNLLADNDDFTIEEKNTSDCGCSTCCETGHENHGSKGFSYGMQYAFGEMIADIGKWLLLGVVIAGVISALIPDAFIEEYIGHGFMSLVVMLVVGLPLYVCATASTPIAASLILKGLSPGAALVFLLAGPATNGATLTVMFRVLGKRAAIVYLVVIAAASLFFGWLVDRLYVGLGLDISAVVSSAGEILPHWVGIASAILLLLFVVRALVKPGACGCQSCSS